MVPIIKNSRRAILLSGTPALSRPLELFTQLNALAPLSWPDEKQFGKRYCKAKKGAFNAEFRGASNTQELHVLLSETLMIRRLKKDILKQLPRKQRFLVRVQVVDEGLRRELQDILSEVSMREAEIDRRKKLKFARRKRRRGVAGMDERIYGVDGDGQHSQQQQSHQLQSHQQQSHQQKGTMDDQDEKRNRGMGEPNERSDAVQGSARISTQEVAVRHIILTEGKGSEPVAREQKSCNEEEYQGASGTERCEQVTMS